MRLFIIPFLVIEILDGHYAGVGFVYFGRDQRCAGWLAGAMVEPEDDAGQYLDPIADKLLLSTLFVVFTHVGLMPRYVTVLVFSRDLGILLIATLLFADRNFAGFSAEPFGKLNTLMQIIALISVLCEKIFASPALCDGRRSACARNRGDGTAVGCAICLDCLSADECATANLGGLFFGGVSARGFFLFDGDIAKLCRIKYFSAALALDEFGVFLAGDDFDDGVFALGGHGWGSANGMDFARL